MLLPCLDEAETIEICIDKAQGFLSRSGVRGEVLVVDNGSADASARLAAARGARVVFAPERGYGAALRRGMLAARGRYIIIGDADDSYDIGDLAPILAKLREGFDLVMGNRFKGGIAPGAMPPLHRYLGNPVLSLIGRLGARVGDFHCGLRGLNWERFSVLNLHTSGMEFASEIVISAALASYRITEVPTILKKDGRSSPSHLRSWRDGWRHLRFLLMFSPRWLFIYPGLGLIAVGLVGTILLFPGPVRIADGVGLDLHTYVVAAITILIGVQSISFGLIVRRFATAYGFLPQSARFGGFLEAITLERGLIVAGMVVAAGVGGFIWSFAVWASVDFGLLEYPLVMRVLIISVTGIAVGIQIAFTAFMSSIMEIPITRIHAREDARADDALPMERSM